MKKLVTATVAVATASVVAAEPTPQELAKMQKTLMAETSVVAQMGSEVPIKDFKSDGNPKTLQIVFLEKKEAGMNSVSEDGEVIFLFEASDEVQSKLIGKAFELRARHRLAAS